MHKKFKSVVIQDGDGQAFWQPGVYGNCITVKTSPWNLESTKHTVFMHELPHGGEVTEHAHINDDEIFICLDGAGSITIDGVENSFKKHDVAFIGAGSLHRIKSTSNDGLKFLVISSPPGLEERFKLMGIPKLTANETPPSAFSSEFSDKNTHGVLR